jgi:hypothetical protein
VIFKTLVVQSHNMSFFAEEILTESDPSEGNV